VALMSDLVRKGSKALFAAADLVMGSWPGPRVLIYHQVVPNPQRQMEVSVDAFEAHLFWLRANAQVVDLEEAILKRGHPDAHKLFVLSFDDGYADLFDTVYPSLDESAMPFTLYLSTKHIETQEPMSPGSQPLTWDQIGKMAEGGLMTLGAHTHNHMDLRHASVSEMEDDLGLSNQLIEDRVGIVPIHFAYPWGYWSPLADTVVRGHYQTAALGGGRPLTSEVDPYLIHRMPVQRSDEAFFFRRKAKRGMRLEEKLRRMLRGYEGP
jgi:peptidoglycan/xylan/chitin deacetylase (PgdA/CDA1 family)